MSESDNPSHRFVIPAKAGTQLEQAMPQRYHVYILASKRNGTLYIGVTNSLAARIIAHRNGKGSEFTRKYQVTRLVLIEPFADVRDAIAREKALKKWNRGWKLRLIEESNPDWDDLFDTLNG
ncbi:GIY-YIG nuclease family protein [Parasphingorhabdus sp.]|uniref:GIY-YIG nuclease family protein n=1 Tax=Parasphingorhabdus sp. TaxID=2709688 RepID=UPI003A906C33